MAGDKINALVLLLSLVGPTLSTTAPRQPWQVGEVVQTSSGPVKGHASREVPSVSEYLGINYAQAPVGNLRWALPVPFKGSGVINADKFGADCPLNIPGPPKGAGPPKGSGGSSPPKGNRPGPAFMSLTNLTGHVMSEDCLFVNVWTKPQSGEKKKAVLLWIHGGGFNLGSANSVAFNGAFLADREDVVVVSIQYRMNIFGFPGAPGLSAQNLGIHDQRAGVEWVHNNIERFGGDPNRITIFGESAGAGAVDYYAYAWADNPNPLVNGFILQSGSVFMTGVRANNRTNAWYKFTSKIGCGGAEAGAEKTLECARGKEWKTVLDAIVVEGSGKSTLDGFGVVADEKVIFKDYRTRGKAGQFIKRPILAGNNNNEAAVASFLQDADTPADPGQAKKLNNLIFTCQSRDAALLRRAQNIPTWRYRYSGDWPNMAVGPPGTGAWHGAEIGMVFGTAEHLAGPAGKNTDEQEAAMKGMMRAWAAFAKDPDGGLGKLGWPMYESGKKTLVDLALNGSVEAIFTDATEVDKECNLTEHLPI